MVHKKEVNYFRDKKSITGKITFNPVRVGSWRGINFRSRELYLNDFMSRIDGRLISQDSEFNSRLGARRWVDSFTKKHINRRGAEPKLKSRCIFVGRGRATNQEMFMTRHTFRYFLKLGLLPGFTKYSKAS